MKTIVVYGSVRESRQGIKPTRYITNKLEERGHDVVLFDAAELKLPLLDKMYKEYPEGRAPKPLNWMAQQIRESDCVVVVTGEYNHSLQPGLTNLMDYFLEEWRWRPSAIVSYSGGSFAGVRAAIQLRAFLAELGMPSIPKAFAVPNVRSAFDEDGTPRDSQLDKRVGRFLDELEWYAGALRDARNREPPPY